MRDYVITGVGNTNDRIDTGPGGVYYIPNTSAQVAINGLGTFQFLSSTTFQSGREAGDIGLGHDGIVSRDLIDGPDSNPPWDMLTAIGPISGPGSLFQWDFPADPIVTTGGMLIFNDGNMTATFTAFIPEPSTKYFLVMCLGVTHLSRRIRF
jgi:hypothetical protein